MRPEFHQPFVLLGDSVEALQKALITALSRQRPCQPDCPDTTNYIEGSVSFWKDEDNTRGDQVIVRISLCCMDNHMVYVGFREVFPVRTGNDVIAQRAASAFWAKVQRRQSEV